MYIFISIMISVLMSIIILKKSPSKNNICLCIAIISGTICFSILSPVFRSTLQNLTLIDKSILVLFGSIFLLATFIYLPKIVFRLKYIKILPNSSGTIVRGQTIITLIIISVITISFASKSSPLYAFNDWCDPNYFLTLGRGILNGKVPYKDLYEQKGPILFFVHAFACLIDYDGFIGAYVIEMIACFLYLFFSMKLVLLFVDDKIVPFIGILSAIVYSSVSLDKGDSCEELCMWCLVYGLYIGLRIIKNDSSLRNYDFILFGFIAAVVLWTKYLMMGFYIGWIIAICLFMLKAKKCNELIKYVGLSVIGALICTFIVLLYFWKNQAIIDLFQSYFYNNIFAYEPGAKGGLLIILKNIIFNLVTKGIKNFLVSLMIVFGFISTYKIKRSYFIFYTCCFLFTVFFIYFKGALFYYSFCLGAFAPFGLITIYSLMNELSFFQLDKKSIYAGIIIAYCLFLSFCPNLRYLSDSKNDMVQYEFRDIILQKENPIILNYGFQDYGFYTVCGVVPECRYFCTFNIMQDTILEEQSVYIERNKPDFVITDSKKNISGYKLIKSGKYYDKVLNLGRYYCLYEKNINQ